MIDLAKKDASAQRFARPAAQPTAQTLRIRPGRGDYRDRQALRHLGLAGPWTHTRLTVDENEITWLAELDGRVVGAVAARRLDHHVVQLRRLEVEPDAAASGVAVALLRTVLDQCRRRGDLKLLVSATIDPALAVRACGEIGFQHTRSRWRGSQLTLEFYLNLYKQPQGPDDRPARPPRPPRLRPIGV